MSLGLSNILSASATPSSSEPAELAEAVGEAIARGCRGHPAIGTAAQIEQLQHFVAAAAWTEAALALVRFRAPEWTVRRVELDDGEWFCALSRYPALPHEFDEAFEGRHRLLPLAIMAALGQVMEHAPPAASPPTPHPALRPCLGQPAWLDNCH